jgi:hypothetical protein
MVTDSQNEILRGLELIALRNDIPESYPRGWTAYLSNYQSNKWAIRKAFEYLLQKESLSEQTLLNDRDRLVMLAEKEFIRQVNALAN